MVLRSIKVFARLFQKAVGVRGQSPRRLKAWCIPFMKQQKRPPELVHGGDWAGYEAEYGRPPLDFSSNVSPLGLPEGVRRAAAQALGDAERYPDPLCRALRGAIAGAEGVDPSWCLCGGGSADLIYRAALARRPRRALVAAPAFAEYGSALELVGCETVRYPLRAQTGFLLQPDFLEAITPDVDMVFLCEPNNPTGRTTPRPLLLAVLERCRETGTLLAVDECFGCFLDDPAAHSLMGELGACGNLLIFKAFTKLYAMAGLRLGYCLSGSAALLEAMARSGQPWAVSGPAQAAGIAALEEADYVRAVRALVGEERPWLQAALEDLGFQVVPGEANYLLFASPVPLLEPLRRRGILLRWCGNYQGLDPTWYRAAVRSREDNRRLIAALRDILQEGR